jgi:arylsulfatase A-like enzyme
VTTTKPNFLFFITDQHRVDHLGCYGNPIVRTPNIDGIAADGLRFENFYVACPICMPNRIVLMTGRMPTVNGSRHNGIPLDLDAVTFVDLLRDAGYRTALIGKSHLQDMTSHAVPNRIEAKDGLALPPNELREANRRRRSGPAYEVEIGKLWMENPDRTVPSPYYGFDFVRFADGHGDQVYGHYSGWLRDRVADPASLRGWRNALPAPGLVAPQAWRTAVPEELYPTSYVEEETIGYLERHAQMSGGDPFFLQCSFPDPHHPFTPPGRYFDMYDPAAIPLPKSFHHVGEHEPAFQRELRAAAAAGRSNASGPPPFALTDETAVRQCIALTYGMITMIDDAIGRVLGKLGALGLDRNTVVIFTTDHGDFMGDHGLMLKHGLHYEGVIHVPFIWSDPDNPGAGTTDLLSGTIDIGSTVLARAGLAPFHGSQGFDIVGAARKNERLPRFGMIVEEDELGVHLGRDEGLRTRTFATERWQLTLWDGIEDGCLFDRESDPEQMHNLWHSQPHQPIKYELMEKMLREMIRLGDTAPLTERVA